MSQTTQEEPKKRVHVLIYESDYEWLMRHFGGPNKYGFSKTVRRIVRSFIRQAEEKRQANEPNRPELELSTEELATLQQPAGGSES